MITLESYAMFEEFMDLLHELTVDAGMTDEAAFIAACAELPALLEVTPDARYAPARIVLFDEHGRPAQSLAW